jgi:hypothetical protein
MKESIAATANELGLSVTEYIEILHKIAAEKIRR